MKIAIIGNGICSLTSAFKLALEISKTDEIFIIGEKRKEGSASNAAAAMLNSFAELEATSLKDDIDTLTMKINPFRIMKFKIILCNRYRTLLFIYNREIAF
mgnify:CR=1 FL=1